MDGLWCYFSTLWECCLCTIHCKRMLILPAEIQWFRCNRQGREVDEEMEPHDLGFCSALYLTLQWKKLRLMQMHGLFLVFFLKVDSCWRISGLQQKGIWNVLSHGSLICQNVFSTCTNLNVRVAGVFGGKNSLTPAMLEVLTYPECERLHWVIGQCSNLWRLLLN